MPHMPTPQATATAFAERHAAWQHADAMACAAERALSRALDRYCEGCGQAPPAPQSAEALRLRRLAGQALAAVLAEIDSARRDCPLL